MVFNHNFERSNPQRASFGLYFEPGIAGTYFTFATFMTSFEHTIFEQKSLAVALINFHVAFVNGLLLRVELTQYELQLK